jgi:hypothetical protein
MLKRLSTAVDWHWTTITRTWQQTPLWIFAVPAVAVAVIYLLNASGAVAPYLTKEVAEISSPIILSIPLAIATWLAATRTHVYYKWQALFALALFLRELHFTGTNSGFYIAIVLLLGWASTARERLEPFFSNRTIVTLLATIIWVYLVSKTFDRRVWDPILPAGTTNDLFEENLELLGHTLFLTLTVVSAVVGSKAAATSPNEWGWSTHSNRTGT